jgi:hypothetical protein
MGANFAYPHVLMNCKTCGYAMAFNAVIMGLAEHMGLGDMVASGGGGGMPRALNVPRDEETGGG